MPHKTAIDRQHSYVMVYTILGVMYIKSNEINCLRSGLWQQGIFIDKVMTMKQQRKKRPRTTRLPSRQIWATNFTQPITSSYQDFRYLVRWISEEVNSLFWMLCLHNVLEYKSSDWLSCFCTHPDLQNETFLLHTESYFSVRLLFRTSTTIQWLHWHSLNKLYFDLLVTLIWRCLVYTTTVQAISYLCTSSVVNNWACTKPSFYAAHYQKCFVPLYQIGIRLLSIIDQKTTKNRDGCLNGMVSLFPWK